MVKSINKWQFGDFQTPDNLANKIVNLLKIQHQVLPEFIVEPSCGKGAFIRASLNTFRSTKIIGLDINPEYVREAKGSITGYENAANAEIYASNFFCTNWEEIISNSSGNILVIGNPPWVTNSELSVLKSTNIPSKSNFQNHRGIEAITGLGNFDISEWMLLTYIKWLSHKEGTIAVLCKYSVARKVIHQIRKKLDNRFSTYIYLIDAKIHFKASVEACLFVLTTEITHNFDCKVYESLEARAISYSIGEREGFMLRDTLKYEKWKHLAGHDRRYVWRSGVKHDCSRVMELERVHGSLFLNGLGEKYDLEETYLYPLLKSSDLANRKTDCYRKLVLMTQRYVGENTQYIQNQAPKTWKYLREHHQYLSNRKSSVYRRKFPYSIFGVGSYSFQSWKVAISGLYKQLNFQLIKPLDGKPVMFDDTVNFLSFETREEAQFIFELITSTPALEFFDAMIFWDEKRPITIDILKRLSLESVAQELGILDVYWQWVKVVPETSDRQLTLSLVDHSVS